MASTGDRPARSRILFYTELLLNINSLSVFVCLPSPPSADSTRAELSQDRRILTVVHKEQTVAINLPRDVSTATKSPLAIPQSSSNELQFRFSLNRENLCGQTESEILSPWFSQTLRSLECAHCCNCRRDVIQPGAVKTWKDLPSENWAEMMEFWHCHKPPETQTQNSKEASVRKGYAAGNRLQSQKGVGFVDASSFLVSSSDCSSVTISETAQTTGSGAGLRCTGCSHALGFQDDLAAGYRLFKSELALGFAGRVQLEYYESELWLSALILSTSELSASRKFNVRRVDDERVSLLMWVFTPDLWFSFNSRSTDDGKTIIHRGLKVLWQYANPSTDKTVETRSNSESIDLSSNMFSKLMEVLEETQLILPQSARTFQNWQVGLLKRFSKEDIESKK